MPIHSNELGSIQTDTSVYVLSHGSWSCVSKHTHHPTSTQVVLLVQPRKVVAKEARAAVVPAPVPTESIATLLLAQPPKAAKAAREAVAKAPARTAVVTDN